MLILLFRWCFISISIVQIKRKEQSDLRQVTGPSRKKVLAAPLPHHGMIQHLRLKPRKILALQ